jgi:hypothetical protein
LVNTGRECIKYTRAKYILLMASFNLISSKNFKQTTDTFARMHPISFLWLFDKDRSHIIHRLNVLLFIGFDLTFQHTLQTVEITERSR